MGKLVELVRKLTDISGVSITLGTLVVAMEYVIVIQITTIMNMGVIIQKKISFNLISSQTVLIAVGMKIVTENQVIMVCQEIHGHHEAKEIYIL